MIMLDGAFAKEWNEIPKSLQTAKENDHEPGADISETLDDDDLDLFETENEAVEDQARIEPKEEQSKSKTSFICYYYQYKSLSVQYRKGYSSYWSTLLP